MRTSLVTGDGGENKEDEEEDWSDKTRKRPSVLSVAAFYPTAGNYGDDVVVVGGGGMTSGRPTNGDWSTGT